MHDSTLRGDENGESQMYINWPNKASYVSSFRENKIHWLTICIKFACLFCKPHKWVAVATATCNLACCRETSLGVPFKKQIHHAFYSSFRPRDTNLSAQTPSFLFIALRMGLLFIFAIYITCNTYLLGKRIKKSIKILLARVSGSRQKHCL